MRRWLSSLLAAALVVCLPSGAQTREETGSYLRVIDGDMIEVSIAGKAEKVRLIGVDTPETVDPRKPVEYLGMEASAFTRPLCEGKQVELRDELGGQDRDKYRRLLRYVFLEDGTLLNAEIIKQGYGHAYTRFPFSRMEEFRGYERQARESGVGPWGGTGEVNSRPDAARAPAEGGYVGSAKSNKYHRTDCQWAKKITPPNLVAFKNPQDAQGSGFVPCKVCNPPITSVGQEPTQASVQPWVGSTIFDDEEIVYVTRTGTKYYRAGCSYLKSVISTTLKDAAARYSPCSVCRPPVPKDEQ